MCIRDRYYSYSAAQWLLVFYLYCMLGWCFESTVVSVGQRRLVNRGFLRGPMPVSYTHIDVYKRQL